MWYKCFIGLLFAFKPNLFRNCANRVPEIATIAAPAGAARIEAHVVSAQLIGHMRRTAPIETEPACTVERAANAASGTGSRQKKLITGGFIGKPYAVCAILGNPFLSNVTAV